MKYLTRTQYLATASLSSSALDLMKDALGNRRLHRADPGA